VRLGIGSAQSDSLSQELIDYTETRHTFEALVYLSTFGLRRALIPPWRQPARDAEKIEPTENARGRPCEFSPSRPRF
jgi:hypothetical protein